MSERDLADSQTEPDVLEDVDRAISALESHPDPAVREAVKVLLEGIDAVHRTGLTHLAQAVHGMAGEAFLNRLTADPAIRLLLMSYNLITVDRRLQAEEALDSVRGHLHRFGVDVELVEVVGGVVYIRVHPRARTDAGPPLSVEAVRQDLESALRAEFLGFQELVIGDRQSDPRTSPIVPLSALRRANRPVYFDVCASKDVPPGTLRAAQVNDVPLLLVNVGGDIHAIRNRCGDSPLPLEFGSLQEAEIKCPWHGCRYDVRSGRRVDAEIGRVQVFPAAVENGRVRVALDVAPNAGGQ